MLWEIDDVTAAARMATETEYSEFKQWNKGNGQKETYPPTPFPALVCAVKWNRERRRRRQLKNPHSVVPISDGSTGNLHSASRKYRGSQQERQLYRREGQGAPPRQHQQHRRRRHPGENRGYWSPSQVKTRGMCPNLRKAAIASRHVKRRVSPYQRHIL